MKPLLAILVVASLCSCTTLANRRDMYTQETVMGPYTRMLKHGIPRPVAVSGTIKTKTTSSDGKAWVPPVKD